MEMIMVRTVGIGTVTVMGTTTELLMATPMVGMWGTAMATSMEGTWVP